MILIPSQPHLRFQILRQRVCKVRYLRIAERHKSYNPCRWVRQDITDPRSMWECNEFWRMMVFPIVVTWEHSIMPQSSGKRLKCTRNFCLSGTSHNRPPMFAASEYFNALEEQIQILVDSIWSYMMIWEDINNWSQLSQPHTIRICILRKHPSIIMKNWPEHLGQGVRWLFACGPKGLLGFWGMFCGLRHDKTCISMSNKPTDATQVTSQPFAILMILDPFCWSMFVSAPSPDENGAVEMSSKRQRSAESSWARHGELITSFGDSSVVFLVDVVMCLFQTVNWLVFRFRYT